MTTIPQIALGSQGLHVSAQGLGCMSMTPFVTTNIYGPVDEAESLRTIHRALELGVNLLDTADIYGPWLNEQLVGRAVAGQRARYTLATKVGGEIGAQGQLTGQVNGRPDYVRRAIEHSLRNLGTEYIDLYYLHRLDPATPIEDTVGAMSQLVAEGKVRYLAYLT
nr:aldo/keto reductase [Hymenobacter sp. AT01-02]